MQTFKKKSFFSLILVLLAVFIVLSIPQLSILEFFIKDHLYISTLRFLFSLLSGGLVSYLLRFHFDKLIEIFQERYLQRQKEIVDYYWKNFLKVYIDQQLSELKTELLRKTLNDYIQTFAPELGENAINELRSMLERLRGVIREDYRREDEIEIIINDNTPFFKISTTWECLIKNNSKKIKRYISPTENLRCYILFYNDIYEKENKGLYGETKLAERYFYAWKVKTTPNNTGWSSISSITLTIENALIDGKRVASETLSKDNGLTVIEASANHIILCIQKNVDIPIGERTRIRFSVIRKTLPTRNYHFYIRELTRNATMTLRVISKKEVKITPYVYLWSVKKPVVSIEPNKVIIDVEDIIFPYGTVHFYIGFE